MIGSGPNGLAAAIELARAGHRVTVLERNARIGGGVRSAPLTLPGFLHDTCSSVYPLGIGSPFFRTIPLLEHGAEWVHPPLPLAHPLDDGTSAVMYRSLDDTAERLQGDAGTWRRLLGALAGGWDGLAEDVLAPPGVPSHPVLMARFAIPSGLPASVLVSAFRTRQGRALFGGLAAHANLPLSRPLTSAFGIVLAVAGHVVGWPFVRGGSQCLADALAAYLQKTGGSVATSTPVESLDDLRDADAVLCDVTPRQLLRLGGTRMPASFQRALARFRYGPGAFKIDWALRGPIPWRAPECHRAGTVHLGGTFEEIASSEADVWQGRHAQKPFVLLAQPSVCDPSRAPEGQHSVWAYCHVPHGSTVDMTERIESQVERFAPGFRELILGRHVRNTAALEADNPNLVGGDFTGGASTIWQTLARPTWRRYSTPLAGIYMCSSSTPPGGGVHGMCGYHAARRVLRDFERGHGRRG